MAEDQQQKKPIWRIVLKRFIKLSLILSVIVFIALTVLSRVGGDGDEFKLAVQDFLTDNTPYVAHIQKLNYMRIFPSISIDVEGVELREGKDGGGETAIRIETAKISMRFFDVMFRPGHFKNIEIKDIIARPGALIEQSVKLDSIAIDDTGDQAAINVVGKIGEQPLNAKMGLVIKGKPDSRIYDIDRKKPLDITIGALRLEAVLKNLIGGGFKLENMTLSIGEEKALRGNFDIDHKGVEQISIKGQARLEPGKTKIDPDLNFDFNGEQRVISGEIQSAELDLSDFAAKAPVIRAFNEIDAILGTQKGAVDLSGLSVDLDFTAENIKSGSLNLGDVKTPVSVKDSQLHIGPVEGKIIKGALSGDIRLDASKQPASLENKIIIKGFDYAALQKQLGGEVEIEGTAHIMLDLKSKGNTLDNLVDGLSGKAGFVGGKGRMKSAILNIWGGGLLNALFPSFEEESDLNVNCVVANLDIENLQGHSDAVFVDTDRVTLHGKGTYDFKTDNLEMTLEPKPKDIAIGDISSAVNISGPLSNLSVSPNVFDLGKKVGGLLLGAVNPAFYALTLADLGLQDDHPCKAFVIEKEVLPPPETKSEDTPPMENTDTDQPAVNP